MDINAISNSYERLSTGSQINRASDNAAGLAITEKMNSEIMGANKNVDNIADMSNAMSTAEGSLNNIQDSLQRMRELALQASNGILTDGDRSAIQDEVNALKEGINSAVKNTEFNTMKLLDGSFSDKNVSMNTNGTGSKISIENTGLESLGIKDFDVTGSFDIEDIDGALEKVSESRSKIGSAQNAFKHATNNINTKILNETNSMSNIKDTDMFEEMSKLKKNQILEQYSMMMQKQRSEMEANKLGAVINFSA